MRKIEGCIFLSRSLVQEMVVKDVTKTESQPNPDGEDEEIEVTEQEEEMIEGLNTMIDCLMNEAV